jgi:hypothetical protein
MDLARAAVYLAGFLSCSIGAFHLALPRIYGWDAGMRTAPDSLKWALNALNAFWATAIILAGLLTILIAGGRWWSAPAGRWALAAFATYWALHTTYLLIWPFPMPASLAWLATAFLGFAFVQTGLHAAGVFAAAPAGPGKAPAQA